MGKLEKSQVLTCSTIPIPFHFFIPKSKSQEVQARFPLLKRQILVPNSPLPGPNYAILIMPSYLCHPTYAILIMPS